MTMKTDQTTIDGQRRRVTVHDSDDDAILNAMAEELSPNAVALIAIRLRRGGRGPGRRGTGVEREVRWFADMLMDRLGGFEACAELVDELDVCRPDAAPVARSNRSRWRVPGRI
jgi:hypothetical protein